ncbi:hypothetical protein Tco_0689795 [Tanacetum coccineum]
MAVKEFMKFFKRRGRFVIQARDDKKSFQRNQDDKNRKAKENALDADIRITLSENVRNHQETKTKGILLEDLRLIMVRKTKKKTKMKGVLWLKHLMSQKRETQRGSIQAYLFEKSTHSLKEMLSSQIPSDD